MHYLLRLLKNLSKLCIKFLGFAYFSYIVMIQCALLHGRIVIFLLCRTNIVDSNLQEGLANTLSLLNITSVVNSLIVLLYLIFLLFISPQTCDLRIITNAPNHYKGVGVFFDFVMSISGFSKKFIHLFLYIWSLLPSWTSGVIICSLFYIKLQLYWSK